MQVGSKVVCNTRFSHYYGLTGTLAALDAIGAFVVFDVQACTHADDPTRIRANVPVPFRIDELCRPEDFRWMPLPSYPAEPNGPLPEELCSCLTFGDIPCSGCAHCSLCKVQIKGSCFDRHAFRHYRHTDEYLLVQQLNKPQPFHEPAVPAPPADSPVVVSAPLDTALSDQPVTQETPSATQHTGHQASLWDF